MSEAMTDKADESGNGDLSAGEPVSPSERTTLDFDQPDAMVGQHLDGRFLIEKNLKDSGADAGGIGVVYLAKDTKLMGKEVVVKILNETALKHSDIVRKFLHEKEALIRLDHPGIVRILDSGTLNDGNPFMVMEFIKGHSLRKALQLTGKLPLDVVASIIEAVTDALSAAHSEKVLHRDIKPENIMLTPIEEGQYRVRLIDFGIARVGESKLAPETGISRAIGSVLYIAPEQLIGVLDITPAADIFSTAIVAYEMLTGELPFKPKAIAEMYKMEKDGVQTPPSELRPDMPRTSESILLCALEFEADKRPQNARAFGRYFAHELRIDGLETDRYYASIQTEFAKMPTEIIPVRAATGAQTVKSVEGRTADGINPRRVKWMIPTIIVLTFLTLTGGYFVWNAFPSRPVNDPSTANTVRVDPGTRHEFSYYLMIQKTRNGKAFETPYKSSGQATVETGYRFNLFFQTDADGYLYVFNEAKNEQGDLEYHILYPTPNNNAGSSTVRAGQSTGTSGVTIKGARGTEAFWMIWSKERKDDLEGVARAAYITQGIVKVPYLSLLINYLARYEELKPELPTKDAENQRMIFKAKGDLIVHRFEVEHQ